MYRLVGPGCSLSSFTTLAVRFKIGDRRGGSGRYVDYSAGDATLLRFLVDSTGPAGHAELGDRLRSAILGELRSAIAAGLRPAAIEARAGRLSAIYEPV